VRSAIQAVVFDFDGVLADSEPLHLAAYQRLIEPRGIHLDERTYCERYLGYDDEGALRRMADDNGLRLEDEEIERLIVEKGHVFEALVGSRDVLYRGAADCVRRLSAAWPVGIASGAERGDIDLILRGARLEDLFRFIVAAGDTERSKPAPDPYLRAVERLRLAPERCLVIEDSERGLRAAKAAGLTCWVIPSALTVGGRFEAADAVLDDLAAAGRRLLG